MRDVSLPIFAKMIDGFDRYVLFYEWEVDECAIRLEKTLFTSGANRGHPQEDTFSVHEGKHVSEDGEDAPRGRQEAANPGSPLVRAASGNGRKEAKNPQGNCGNGTRPRNRTLRWRCDRHGQSDKYVDPMNRRG